MAKDEWGVEINENEGDEFVFDGAEHNSDTLGGESVNKKGRYMFEIVDAEGNLSVLNDKGKPQSPHIVFHCQVLAADKGCSPIGSKLFHRVYFGSVDKKTNKVEQAKEGTVKSGLRFGLGLGILKEVERDGKQVVIDARTGSTKISPSSFMAGKGKMFCSEVIKEDDTVENGKVTFAGKFALPFGRVYHPSDPFVEDWPKDLEALKAIGVASGKSSGGGSGGRGKSGGTGGGVAGKSSASKPAQGSTVPPTTPPEDEFDDDL